MRALCRYLLQVHHMVSMVLGKMGSSCISPFVFFLFFFIRFDIYPVDAVMCELVLNQKRESDLSTIAQVGRRARALHECRNACPLLPR